MTSTLPQDVFDNLKLYFEVLKGDKRRFRCLICTKDMAGSFSHFRSHVWSSHNDQAIEFGLEQPVEKKKPPEVSKNLCRLCLRKSRETTSIFLHRKRNLLVVDLISQLIPEITIEKDDGYSQVVCHTCLEIVFSACDLRESSIKNDKRMREDQTDDDNPLEFQIKEEPVEFHPVKNEHAETSQFFSANPVKEEFVDVDVNQVVEVMMDSFNCKHCEKVFNSHDSLLLHNSSAHSQEVFKCDICENKGIIKAFKVKSRIEEHMKACHSEESWSSFPTVDKTDQDNQLKVYFEVVRPSSKRRFRCLMCEKQLCGTFANFRHHVWSTHNHQALSFGMDPPTEKQRQLYNKKHRITPDSDDEYECDRCDRAYRSKESLRQHKKRSHGKKTTRKSVQIESSASHYDTDLKCKVCNVQFESRASFSLHSYIHSDYVEEYREPDQKFACSLCAFESDVDEDLQQHLLTHMEDFTNKTFLVCIKCSQTFDNYQLLVNHTNDHNLRITHKCLKCNKKFPYGDKLLRHLKRYQEGYICDICGHCDTGKRRLEEHIRVIHMSEVCFLCPFCGESKSSNHGLKSHIKARHENIRKFKCSLCPKTFLTAAYYRNHQSVHTNILTFSCSKCPKMFKSYRNLKRHQMFHDPSKLNYKYLCDYDNCGKRFYTNYGKNRHMLTHTGIRPWICDFEGCDRSFSQSNDLNKHRRLHVGECTYKCDYSDCTMAFKYVQDLRIHLSDHYQKQ